MTAQTQNTPQNTPDFPQMTVDTARALARMFAAIPVGKVFDYCDLFADLNDLNDVRLYVDAVRRWERLHAQGCTDDRTD